MPLFQKSVLKKHLQDLKTAELDVAYQRYTAYFHNATIQQNIRNAKEEQFQEGFLRELFGTVLNYTLNPNPNFNLTTELKNTTNSKKADGAILVNDKAVAVIELKGTDTTDLNKIETQAFGYKNNQAECNYVITSNFEKLRFYIDNTIDFEEFNLFTLTREQFSLLYLCLSYDSIKNNIPKRLKAESVSQEDQITKKLYKDYSEFKRALFSNLVELNPEFDKLLLFKKTQKLLDRFLFIFFAEDTNLLPTNLIFRINKEWKNLQEMRIPVSLYERYKMYFNDLNHGAKVTLPAFGNKTGEAITAEFEIFAYNGGLFQADEVLDNVKIDDTVLHTYSEKLSHYDFDSDVDVNILGHIFENSLNEIDEIKSELEGTAVDKSKTKRKKDGVFYTPKYITKYIVDNTVGKLCEEKKAELSIKDEDYISTPLDGRSSPSKSKKKALLDKLSEYREWLLQLTICDPACGSGAFLNQALDFLIAEHRYVDELQAKLMGDSLVLSDIENSILENNIYGVDLNDESVEIAKLSLWLRTAQKGRKLNSLNNNIKCGNSLIDDPSVAGDKAFSWEKEFPEVFADKVSPDGTIVKSGGFDVVIGNPPYLVVKGGRWVGGFQYNNEALEILKKNFETASQQINTYNLFLELGLKLTKPFGMISQITPNTFLANEYSQKLREYLIKYSSIVEILNAGLVFEDASVETAVITYLNGIDKASRTSIKLNIDAEPIKLNLLEIMNLTDDSKFIINVRQETISLLTKLSKLKKISSVAKVWRGLTTGDDKKFLSDIKVTENHKPLITGSEVRRYFLCPNQKFVNYIPELLDRARDERIFLLPEKLISKFVGDKLTFCYDNSQNYVVNTACSIEVIDNSVNLFFLLSILNSKLINFYFQQFFSDSRSTFPIMKSGNIEALPFVQTTNSIQLEHSEKVSSMMILMKDKNLLGQKFSNYIQANLNIEKLPTKLQNWHDLTFPDFIKELNKAIKTSGGTLLTKKDEFEWMELFEENKKKALELKAEIDKTDKEIDQMVYELYGLTEEEVKIVEGV